MHFSLLAAFVALAPAALAIPATPVADASLPGSTANVAGLHAVAKAAGKLYLGTATDNNELTNTQYTAILEAPNMFGQITAENTMKWDATEPQQNVFTFAQGDQIANLARSHGMLLRGHNCVWHQQLPSWVTAGNFNAQQLTQIIQNHCGTVVGHYRGQVWDVVNEPLNDDGSFRQDVFFNTLGSGYIATALRAARAADPAAKLYINEFNVEGLGAKSTALKNLVTSLKQQGVPIDGVGFQCHFIVGQVPTTLIQSMQQFTALGLEVAITELDIRMTLPETAALLQQQKQDFQTVIHACKSVAGCVGVTVWDFTDKFSFVPSTFPGQGAATPWDQNLVKKPAFDGIVAGFQQ
ncbi:endo-beta-1,4-glucanase [Trametes versicolor FP-101664 SS1]|uniref:endo-beta-1,4-glucanase n=1 Tax=Trametes versicolor (strain FP-101664) TaxID=717944 RepID=UPI0004622D82|nr:endo-beta-1,4-glucanase [Trametes versicolor FP-101664 SS1]EIW62496.1 endo-beta-1,4-glucanase [Trametes versicolor FP-101664 SS1]